MLLISDDFEKKIKWLLSLIFVLSLVYSVFSYALTDVNLTLTSWAPYWNFQQWMWHNVLTKPDLMVNIYQAIIGSWFLVYLGGIRLTSQTDKVAHDKPWSNKKLLGSLLLAISPLFLSYNALSHDVFNYLFNAKMVWVYQANPHIKVALDFFDDPWIRFMHNIHTPAPYGYGWTALSLIPFALGFQKFLPTWLLFRLFAVLSLVLLFVVLQKLVTKINQRPLTIKDFWLVFLNPLLIIEIVSNQHNDLWMMVPALAAFAMIVDKPQKRSLLIMIGSGLLLALSATTKLATVVLFPLWSLGILRWVWPKIARIFSWQRLAWLAAVAMFVPLLTSRSQQFLPWYLIWSLVWLPVIKEPLLKAWLIIFSLAALLRYVPWLRVLEYNDQVLSDQRWAVWGVGIGLWFGWQLWYLWRKMRYNDPR